MIDTQKQAADQQAGGNTALFHRSANERRVLSIIKDAGSLPASEIARKARLSAQSASVITRGLEADGLIVRGEAQRGKIGKPVTPFRLNPDGAYAVGLRIGRRSADMVLIDFFGEVLGRVETIYSHPTPDRITEFGRAGLAELRDALSEEARSRIVGLGIAIPFEMWNWLEVSPAPRDEMQTWQDFDVAGAFEALSGLPVEVANDSSLACSGEHAFGAGSELSDFAYFYVGSLIGGGVVLGGATYLGPTGNAAAFGSLPVRDRDGAWRQLNSAASVAQLERAIEARHPGEGLRRLQQPDWSEFGDLVADWIDATAETLAYAAMTAVASFDVPAVVIDSGTPDAVRRALVDRVRTLVPETDHRGIRLPDIIAGQLGTMAGALGAAYRPILIRLLQT